MDKKSIGQIHHLIRYFFLFGILAFVAYIKRWSDDASLVVMGPPLYLTYGVKNAVSGFVGGLTETVTYYAILLPLTILYFSFIGFQTKQLWNEKGPIRFISLLAMAVFLIYIHYITWKNLSAYFTVPF